MSPETDISTTHDTGPTPGYAYTNAAERLLTAKMQERANVATIRQLQQALADFAPLQAAYEAEMAGRRKHRFGIDTRETWARDLARRLAGVCVEDAGAVADSLQDRAED